MLHIIPRTFFDAFTGSGDLLQVLFVARAVRLRDDASWRRTRRRRPRSSSTACSHVFFAMMNALMKLAPLGAGGAMAFTIGRYGVGGAAAAGAADGQLLSDLPAVRAASCSARLRAFTGFNIFASSSTSRTSC